MNARGGLTVVLSCSALALATTGVADQQSRDAQTKSASAPQEVRYRPVNLRILPQDITALEIKKLMERYTEELGVSCEYCHTQNPQTQRLEYASDDNPAKLTARVMIAMLTDINTRYLAQLGGDRYAPQITCGNCHQGQADPPAFEPSLRR